MMNSNSFKDKVIFGKNVLVGDNVSIGSNCMIGHNTIIEQNVSIGDNCSIGSNVISVFANVCFIPNFFCLGSLTELVSHAPNTL